MDVKDISTKLQKIDANHERINAGGCAVFAVELYKTFRALGISAKIYVLTHAPSKMHNDARKKLKKMGMFNLSMLNDMGLYFNHVVIEAAGAAFDSTGSYPSIDFVRNKWNVSTATRYSLRDMKKLASAKRGWNQSFDRTQIPSIKKQLKSQFIDK